MSDKDHLTEGEQKEILSYIRGNYDRNKIPSWLLDLIDGVTRIEELTAELAALKSEIVTKDKKVTDYEKELRQLHKYDKTCSTCRYLDENQNCVLGIRCVNYALWQGRIL